MFKSYSNEFSFRVTVLYSLMILIISHGAYNTYFPNLIINAFALILIVILNVSILLTKGRYQSFIISLFIISHFEFLNNWSGLHVLTSFFSLSILLILKKSIRRKLLLLDKKIIVAFFVFIISNVIGWYTKNTSDIAHLLSGIFAFFGYIFVFLIMSVQKFEPGFVRNLVKSFVLMSSLSLIASLNVKFNIITLNSPFFPHGLDESQRFFLGGFFNHTELYGEYGLIMVMFFLPIYLSKNLKALYGLKNSLILLGLGSSMINLFLSFSRSAFFLVLFGILIIIFHTYRNPKFYIQSNYLKLVFVSGLFIVALWFPMNLGYMFDRFNDPQKGLPFAENIENINLITGEGTPRELAFSYFFSRIKEEEFIIGYGWGTYVSNKIAWFLDPDTHRRDYHSFYLSMIPLFGWIGSCSFLFIIFYSFRNLYLKYKRSIGPYKVFIFSLLMMILFLLLNEYKISAFRITSYYMLLWIWLGLVYSIGQKQLVIENYHPLKVDSNKFSNRS